MAPSLYRIAALLQRSLQASKVRSEEAGWEGVGFHPKQPRMIKSQNIITAIVIINITKSAMARGTGQKYNTQNNIVRVIGFH